MIPFRPVRFRRPAGAAARAAAAGVFFALFAASARGIGAADMPVSRYDVILQKAPFGPPPPSGPTEEDLKAAQDALDAAQTAADQAWVIPPGLDKIKITLLSRYRGRTAVGFDDGETAASYYLHEGEEFNGISCVAIDFDARTATLAKDGHQAELPIWVNPVTTNRADVTTFGQPGGKAVDLSALQTKTDWEVERDEAEKRRRIEEQREERRRLREEREEKRRQESEALAKLTPEQRDRRLRDINLEIIRSGSGPPLPIELNEEDIRRLEKEGFEIPSEAERAERAARAAEERRRRAPPGIRFRNDPPPDRQ